MGYATFSTTLGSHLEVLTGHIERHRSDHAGTQFRLIQGRDVGVDGAIDWARLDRCADGPGARRAQIFAGDLLVATRTTAPRAVLVESPPDQTCASGQFAILRGRDDRIDPAFLCWLLNSEPLRSRLRAAFRGSKMPFLAASDLAALELVVPPIERQRKLARIFTLRQRLAALQARLDRSLDLALHAASCGAAS